MDTVDLILSQAPDNTDKAIAEEAFNIAGGNIADAIAYLWDRTLPQKPTASFDPVQAKWASIRDIADSITVATHEYRNRPSPQAATAPVPAPTAPTAPSSSIDVATFSLPLNKAS